MANRPWFGLFRVVAIIALAMGAIYLLPCGLFLLLLWLVGEPEPFSYTEAFALALGCLIASGFFIKAVVHLVGMRDTSKPASYDPTDEVCKKCRRFKGYGQCVACGFHAQGPRQAMWLFVLIVVPLALGASIAASQRPFQEIGYLIYVGDLFATVWCACLWRRGRI
jgi:hypothetical protein